mmetsp:Transcript_9990/g.27929  ORF Transcript_9990/g.27929 Transcript_9990/m.27929 type:complete len:261 (-) Transcript_9990:460-1242(-)
MPKSSMTSEGISVQKPPYEKAARTAPAQRAGRAPSARSSCAHAMAARSMARNQGRRKTAAEASGITPRATRPRQLATESMDTSTEVVALLPPSAETICPTWFRTTRPLPMPTKVTRNRSQKPAEASASRGATSGGARGAATVDPSGEPRPAAPSVAASPCTAAGPPRASCQPSSPKHAHTAAKASRFTAKLTPQRTRTMPMHSRRMAIASTTPKPRPRRGMGVSRSPCCACGTKRSSGAQSAPRALRATPRNSRNSEVRL